MCPTPSIESAIRVSTGEGCDALFGLVWFWFCARGKENSLQQARKQVWCGGSSSSGVVLLLTPRNQPG